MIKKSILVAAALLVIIAMTLCSCSDNINGIKETVPKEINNTSQTEPKTGVANPVEEVESVSDITDRTGIEMKDPEDVEDKIYSVIKGDVMIGQIQFTYKDADFSYRAAKTEKDISGIYVDSDGTSKAAGEIVSKNQDPVAISDSEIYARWFNDDGVQFSLYSDGAVMADYEAIYSQVK